MLRFLTAGPHFLVAVCCLSISVFVSVSLCCDKIPHKQLEEGKAYRDHSFRIWSIMVRELKQLITSLFRKQGEMNLNGSTYFLLVSLGPQPLEWYHIYLGYIPHIY